MLVLRRVLAASRQRSLSSTRTVYPLSPVLQCAPQRAFPLPPLEPQPPPPSPLSNVQSGVDIACTNSKTSERQSRRPKALATYPGSPHAAFVVGSMAGWLDCVID